MLVLLSLPTWVVSTLFFSVEITSQKSETRLRLRCISVNLPSDLACDVVVILSLNKFQKWSCRADGLTLHFVCNPFLIITWEDQGIN